MILVATIEDPIVAQQRVVKEWLADGQILCYRLDNTQRTTVNACADDFVKTISDWPCKSYLRLMIHLQSEDAVITAYALHRAREVCRIRPDIHGQLAVVVTNRMTSQIASLVLRGLPLNSNRARLVFSSEPEAIAWLLQGSTIA